MSTWIASFVPSVLKNLTFFSPIRFTLIYCYEQGVKYRLGNPVGRLNHRTGFGMPVFSLNPKKWMGYKRTGLHFHWAWFESITTHSNQEKVLETQYQTLTTKDGKSLTMSFTFSYKIFNALWMDTRVTDFEHSLENRCQQAVSRCVVEFDKDQICQDPETLLGRINEEISEDVYEWGVEILSVGTVNMVEAKNIRLIGNGGINEMEITE